MKRLVLLTINTVRKTVAMGWAYGREVWNATEKWL
jgi:hypothetical protein